MSGKKTKKKRVIQVYVTLQRKEDQTEKVINKFNFHEYLEVRNDTLEDIIIKARIIFSVLILLAFFVSFITLLIMRVID
ncbi:hypothetical protein ACHRVW_15025 [Flavobacterium collinsii]|uniref:hypothetical protein n=1 Tax=Flavobacterium collinsii TaxID=1114861 RepID=UPI0021E07AB1|nr:hypothetical protein [Flavobacterium collinsii]GIQ57555.1 hypothetical protein Flavo103_06910 [Flavobacterium collinsii]